MEAEITQFPRGRMTTMEYVRERARIRTLYGDGSKEAAAKSSHALAKLFAWSGWTQDDLAAQEGRSREWVSKRLCFGRFLDFGTNVPEVESRILTEGRFRTFWDRTDKSATERRRFDAIITLVQAGTQRRRSIIDEVVAETADGEWHDPQAVAAKIGATKKQGVKRSSHIA